MTHGAHPPCGGISKAALKKRYIDNQESIVKISRALNMAPMTVYKELQRHKIPIRKQTKYQIPKEVLLIEYLEKTKTIMEIADIFGCSARVITSQLQKYQIPIRTGKPLTSTVVTKEVLVTKYKLENKTIRKIGKELGVSERYVSDKLKEFKIKRNRGKKKDLKEDLTKKKIGKLCVKERIKDLPKYVTPHWLCQCDCGNLTKVRAAALLSQNPPRSCGCARAANWEWVIPPYFWNLIKTKAVRRGIDFDVSKKFVEQMFLSQNKKCALSGLDIGFARRREVSRTTASLDRICSSLGYTENNVQWIHKDLNRMKNVYTNEQFIGWCELVANNFRRNK